MGRRPSFTLGIEEEFQIIDPETRALKAHIQELFAEGESRLLFANQHTRLDPCFLPHTSEERGAIRRLAHGARRDRFDPLSAQLLGERRHPNERLDGLIHGFVGYHSRLVDAGAQSRRSLQFIDDPD